MNESILERIQSSAKALKIDLYTAELASYADEKELTPEALDAVCGVFEYLEQKKYDSMVHTMLKLSKLPMNEPKTFVTEEHLFSVRSVCKKKSGLYWTAGRGQNPSGYGFWPGMLPERI